MENRQYTQTNITTPTHPTTTTIATVHSQGNVSILLSTGQVEADSQPLPERDDWTTQYLELPDNQDQHFIEEIQQHKAMTTGDGSWKHGHSVGGFMSFKDAGDEDIIIGFQGGNDVQLDMEDGNAYVGELGVLQVQ